MSPACLSGYEIQETTPADKRSMNVALSHSAPADRNVTKRGTAIGVCLSLFIHTTLVLAVLALAKSEPVTPTEPEGIRISLDVFTSPTDTADRAPVEPAPVEPAPAKQPTVDEPVASQTPTVVPDTPAATASKTRDTTITTAVPERDERQQMHEAKYTPVPRNNTPVSEATLVSDKTPLNNDIPVTKDTPEDEDKTIIDNPPQQAQVTLVAISSTTEEPGVSADNAMTESTSDARDNTTGINQNSTTGVVHEQTSYAQAVRLAVLAQRSYPQRARRKKLTGTVVVGFRVFTNGTLESARVIASSGHSILDRAAVNAVNSVGRFKPFPDEINRLHWDFEVPVVFR